MSDPDRLAEIRAKIARKEAMWNIPRPDVDWLLSEVERSRGDRMLADVVLRAVRAVQAGIGSSGERVKVDGLWVLVTVERSTSQRDVIGPT